MAIEKTSFKVSRVGMEFSSRSRESVSSEDDELQRQSSVVESEEDEEFNDCDSGAGSDDFDLLELGEVGEEFCQVGDQTCSVPLELYDLPGLGDVLSMDVWNECLTEEERFNLTKYLPDMEQEAFMRTLKEIFTGSNLHFGSPVTKLFHMLKGGLCEPRVALYRQGLNSFQKRQHYHLLQKHQNSMVTSLYQIRDAWLNCRGYSIEEKLRILNIMKSQKSLMCENMEELESDSSERDESGKGLWGKKLKDWKHGLKMGRHSAYGASSTLDIPSQGRSMPLEQTKFGKQNPKGTLKLVGSKTFLAKEIVGRVPSVHHGVEMKSGSYGSPVAAVPRQNKSAGYDVGAAVRVRDHMRGVDDAGEKMYEVAVQRDHSFSRVGAIDKYGAFKMGKKHEGLRGDGYTSNSFLGFPGSLKNDLHAYSSNRTVNMLSDIKVLTAKPSNVRTSYDYGRKVKYPDNFQQFSVEEQIKYGNSRAQNLPLKGGQNELSDGGIDPSFKYSDWNVKNKKWKIERESSDLQVNGRLSQSEYPAKPSHDMVRAISMQNGGREMDALRGNRRYERSEETESDSSDQVEEDEEDNPLMRSKLAYPRGVLDGSFSKSGPEPKNARLPKKDKKNKARPDGLSHSSKKLADIGEHPHTPEVENYSLKAKQKGKMHDIGRLQNRVLEDSYFSGSGMLNGDVVQKQIYKLGKNGQLHGEPNERFRVPLLNKAHPTETRQKGDFGSDFSVHQSINLHGYGVGEEDDSLGTFQLAEDDGVTGRLGKKSKVMEAYGDDRYERFDVPLSSAKKQKVKENVTCDDRDENHCVQSNPQQQVVDATSTKKRGKRKLEDDLGNFEMETSEPPVAGLGTTDVELEPVPHKKPFTLITPTVHNGFSFSIIHFLSAVRMAMITLLPEDTLEVGKQLDTNVGIQKLKEEQDIKHLGTNGVLFHESLDINKPEKLNTPSLAVEEIVNRVRSNPGDPCILETQEPLKDLVRGVLKIFSSKTAPLGAKGWKPLVFYDKSTKNWSWIGPVSHSSSDQEAVEEVTSPESWGLPHKMLVKLVDSFANWLKSGQETLQQIGSLPAPPSSLMQFNLDEKERFRDLRAQKSLTTISPSSEEVRAYFRKEEVLRYSIPDRAFSYTAIDGRKSIVAPLKRCGGKPTSKARDHFMLKCDRPPHVTILCLVRDAAARLPGSIGTRADVSTLIRDSQFIVEDVSDAQVNQVVSGALDRLHYERDPCVQFDGERKLWVYLHREREEEDFEDDGTSSTKKWKRPKKEAPEQFEQGTVTVAYHGAGEQTGFELSSDLNVEPPNERTDPIRENGSPCQENSTNEDFDDETFG